MGTLAYFVSSHGYGHAARACAVMSALGDLVEGSVVEIFTTVPKWFFDESVDLPFNYHPVENDIGLVQRNSLEEDPEATADRLTELVPPPSALVDSLAGQLRRAGCSAVACDISALGLEVAQQAGLPAILIENFTWDWIYAAYLDRCPRLAPFAEHLGGVFNRARLRVQTEPACQLRENAVSVPPVARPRRSSRAQVRRVLGIPQGAAMVLLTMGGIRFDFGDLERLRSHPDAFFVVPGATESGIESGGRLLALGHHSEHYHPDLVSAADLVVGKVGYSTLAEVYHSKAAFAFVPRPAFPESPVLGRFVEEQMNGLDLAAAGLDEWRWLEHIEQLAGRRSAPGPKPNGAPEVARVILGALG